MWINTTDELPTISGMYKVIKPIYGVECEMNFNFNAETKVWSIYDSDFGATYYAEDIIKWYKENKNE